MALAYSSSCPENKREKLPYKGDESDIISCKETDETLCKGGETKASIS